MERKCGIDELKRQLRGKFALTDPIPGRAVDAYKNDDLCEEDIDLLAKKHTNAHDLKFSADIHCRAVAASGTLMGSGFLTDVCLFGSKYDITIPQRFPSEVECLPPDAEQQAEQVQKGWNACQGSIEIVWSGRDIVKAALAPGQSRPRKMRNDV